MSTPACPTEQELIEYCDGRLESARAEEIKAHLANCGPCTKAEDWIRSHLLQPLSGGDDTPPSDLMASTQFLANPGEHFDEPAIDLSLLSESQDERAIGRLGKYDILKMLGQGGMGVVLHGHNDQLRRDVAIKMLNRSLSASPVARRRFIREARAAAAINHPNVVIIHDVDEHHGVPFIVMEMVVGRTLREEIRRETKIDPIRVIRLGAQIALGLASAHAQGVIHRDIKPGNIMLEDAVDRVKIADFGLARAAIDNIELTSRELAVGTPAYMSPEQVSGEDVDARSDLFALGCVIHAMLTGHSPFHGRNALEMARKVESHVPLNLHTIDSSTPVFLAEIVDKLLAKDPDQRFQSAAEVADLLNRHLAMINQAHSDEVVHLMQTTSLTSRAPGENTAKKKSAATIWWGAGTVLVAATIALLLAASELRTMIAGNAGEVPPTQRLVSNVPPQSTTKSTSKGPVRPPREYSVSQDGDADFQTLGEALGAAEKGDTIRVLDNGTYIEAVEIGGVRHQGLELISERRATLTAPTTTDGERHTLTLRDTREVTIRGLDIRSAGQGHAVFVVGTAADVLLDSLNCENTSTTGPYATLQVFVAPGGADNAPLRIANCEVINRGVSPSVWLHESQHPVVLTGNTFSSNETCVVVWDSCQRLDISHNIFLNAQDGIALAIRTWPEACHIKIINNTFLSSRAWLAFTDEPTAGGTVEVINNLVLGSARVGMTEQQLAEATRDWEFSHNHWERGTHTLADAGKQGTIAILHEPGSLRLSREASAQDFVVPPPDSELLTAGVGNDLPWFVGAKGGSDARAEK